MTGKKLDKDKIREAIINYIKKHGGIKNLSSLRIYRNDPMGIFAEYFRMKKEGILYENNNVTYLTEK